MTFCPVCAAPFGFLSGFALRLDFASFPPLHPLETLGGEKATRVFFFLWMNFLPLGILLSGRCIVPSIDNSDTLC